MSIYYLQFNSSFELQIIQIEALDHTFALDHLDFGKVDWSDYEEIWLVRIRKDAIGQALRSSDWSDIEKISVCQTKYLIVEALGGFDWSEYEKIWLARLWEEIWLVRLWEVWLFILREDLTGQTLREDLIGQT